MKILVTLFISTFLLIACGSSSGPTGLDIYNKPDPQGNSFACESCHAISEPAADGFRRPGHPIGDATKRTTYKNGQLTDMLDAVNSCRKEWMATTPWSKNSSEWKKLYSWLDQLTPTGTANNVNYTILSPSASTAPGNVTSGQELFNASCAVCHGIDVVGTTLAPSLSGELLISQGGADFVAKRVRTSGLPDSPVYSGLTGGRMPFWSQERLSDEELADISVFLLQHEPSREGNPTDTSGNAQQMSIADLSAPGDCSSTHPRVGQSITLNPKAHSTSGKATILNDCTIEFSDFNYDGGGIDVRLYVGTDGDFKNGTPVGPDLRKSGGYKNETLYFQLPSGLSLSDFNSVSIWCVDVAADFASATFPDP